MSDSKPEVLLQIARRPAVTVPPDLSVQEAAQRMAEKPVGAAAVIDEGRLVGIVTERDVLLKVAAPGREAAAVRVREVMSENVESVSVNDRPGDALRRMTKLHIRHLPVVDDCGQVLGIVSIRHLLQHRLDKLATELDTLESFLAADGPGG